MATQTVPSPLSSPQHSQKVTLICNECGKKRSVSADGQYNDRCPKCGGVDWDVVEPTRRPPVHPQLYQGTTITDLDKMVENCLVTGPFMSLAQIRILLRVADACEPCGATGSKDGVRCAACQGRGYRDQGVQ